MGILPDLMKNRKTIFIKIEGYAMLGIIDTRSVWVQFYFLSWEESA